MHQKIIGVDNIKCGACVSTNRKALLAVDGINAVEVDQSTGLVAVTFTKANPRVNCINILARRGYPETKKSMFLTSRKSYVSRTFKKMKE